MSGSQQLKSPPCFTAMLRFQNVGWRLFALLFYPRRHPMIDLARQSDCRITRTFMAKIPVLIVGAGPSGLNLSLALARRNVPHRVISDANGPGEQSRAIVVQARTLD